MKMMCTVAPDGLGFFGSPWADLRQGGRGYPVSGNAAHGRPASSRKRDHQVVDGAGEGNTAGGARL